MLMNSVTKKIMNFTMIIGILLIPIIAILYVIATIHLGVFSMATQNYGGAMFLDGIGIICLSWINR